jgi:actin-related protein 5
VTPAKTRRLGACLAIGRGLDLVMALSTELTSDVPLAIFTLPLLSQPSIPQYVSYDPHRNAHTPLVIDNGSTCLRFGFATSTTPQVIPNIVSKYKERRAGRQLLLFGDAIDTEGGARSQAKTPWEGDVLLNFDALVSTT